MLDRASFDPVAHILNGPTGRRWYADGEPTWKQGRHRKTCENQQAGEKGTPPAREGPTPSRQRQRLCIGISRYSRELFQKPSMPERCLPRMFKGVPALVRQRRQHCRVATEALVRRELRLARASICGRKARSRYDVRASQASPPILLEGGWNSSGHRRLRHQHERARGRKVRSALAASCLDPRSATKNPRRLRNHLKTRFPASKIVRRPLRIVRYDGSPTGLGLRIENRLLASCISPTKKEKRTRLRLDATRAIDPYAPCRRSNSRLLFIELALRIGCSSSAGPQFLMLTTPNPYPLTIGIILIDCRIHQHHRPNLIRQHSCLQPSGGIQQ